MKNNSIVVEILRWCGAVLLPVPVACIVSVVASFIIRIGEASADRYTGGSWWLSGVFDCCMQLFVSGFNGFVIPICAYVLAPRAKFYVASVITAVYATLSIGGITFWCFMCPFNTWKFITYIAVPIGMVVGVVYSYYSKLDNTEE